MKIVFLDVETLGKDISTASFSRFGEVMLYDNTSPSQVVEHIGDAEAVMINKVKLNRDNLQFAKNLLQRKKSTNG